MGTGGVNEFQKDIACLVTGGLQDIVRILDGNLSGGQMDEIAEILDTLVIDAFCL